MLVKVFDENHELDLEMKVKIFDETHELDLENKINVFLKENKLEVIDIKYSVAVMYDEREQIYCYSAMIIYKKR